jgi:hypothetical protein
VRLFPLFSAAAAGITLAVLSFLAVPYGRFVAAAATPPPTPPPIGTPAAPAPAAATPTPAASNYALPATTPAPAPSAQVKPTPTPPANARKGLDGVWEVEIQHPNLTDYTHFKLTQQGDALTGTYLDAHNKRYPLSGTVDGQDVRLIVTMPNGTTILMEGKLDGTTDMVGMLTMPNGQVPFTASYRAKEKWIENVNPSPGGIPSSSGGYTPP